MSCVSNAISNRPMGLGVIGQDNIDIKRKFRWTFEIEFCDGKLVPSHFVRLAARPNISIEDTQIDFLNGRTWIPGKASWETIQVTYYDIATGDNIELWNWLASVYDFTKPERLNMGSRRRDYAGTGTLILYDGCGNATEGWVLNDAWPQAVNFQDLDYGSSDTIDIELTLRYSRVCYQSFCGGEINPCTCTPC